MSGTVHLPVSTFQLIFIFGYNYTIHFLIETELAKEFLTIVDKSPSRLKKRIQENFRMAVEVRIKHTCT